MRATQPEPHPKGRTFTLLTEARVGDELVWKGESTNLRRGGGDESAAGKEAEPGEAADLRDEAEWSLPGDLGRRYAGVSGDRNPIHLYGVTAKAFGFPRQIAHGMWTKARCLAQLDSRLPDGVRRRRRLQEPDPAAVQGEVRLRGGGRRDRVVGPLGPRRHPAPDRCDCPTLSRSEQPVHEVV